MKTFFIILSIPIIIIFLIFGAWLIAIPEGMISDLISDSVKSDKVLIKLEGIEKGFFFNLNIRKIEIKKKDETLLAAFENVNISPDFLSLLKLNPQLPFAGQMHSGIIEGVYVIKEDAFILNGKDIKLGEINSLKLIGIDGEGNLSLKLEIIKGQGEIIFNVRDARLKATTLPGGFILPLNWFHDIKGLLSAGKETTEVKSFTLEGEGVYARVKGNITGNTIDLKMEVMPEASFKKQSLLILIEPFKASPGYYVIPIKLKGLLVKIGTSPTLFRMIVTQV